MIIYMKNYFMKQINKMNNGLSDNELKIILNIINSYKDKITKVGIFGSRANGKYKGYSDLDLVLYGNLEQKDIDRINTLFDESSLGLKIDIKGYNFINYPPLKRHIDESAKTLFIFE